MTVTLDRLKVKLFTDGADKAQIVEMARHAHVAGFTTNPSLLRKAGVTDYEAHARALVEAVPDRHFSFEVIADDIDGMRREALLISRWGENVHVKLPVSTTAGEPLFPLVRELSHSGVKVNVTAVFDLPQVEEGVTALDGGAPACLSVFAGRLADMGLEYAPAVTLAVTLARQTPNVEVIWASTREVWNVIEADRMGCHIITAPADVLKKLPELGSRTAAELSLDAVKAFRKDVEAAGLSLPVAAGEAAG